MYRRWGKGRLLALDVATGLAFLHAHDIIHFDIKSKFAVARQPLIFNLPEEPPCHICTSQFPSANLHQARLSNACGIMDYDTEFKGAVVMRFMSKAFTVCMYRLHMRSEGPTCCMSRVYTCMSLYGQRG